MPFNPATVLRHQARCSRAQMKMLPRATAKAAPAGNRFLPVLVAMSIPLAGMLAAFGISSLV